MKTLKKISLFSGSLLIILASSVAVLTACHSSHLSGVAELSGSSQEIINGKPVPKTNVTYAMTARILQKSGGAWMPVCTASILAPDLILTAAHCVEGAGVHDVRIAFGAQPLTYEGQADPDTRVDVEAKFKTVAVKKMETHPGYGHTSYDDDMALLLLDAPVPEGFKKVSLLSNEQVSKLEEKKDYKILLVGFGMFKEEPSTESAVLRSTSVSAQFEGDHLITDQTKGSGGCNGDSGGPAYLKIGKEYFLVGVTHGPTEGVNDCHHQGVWGNPSKEKDFLNKAAEKMGSAVRF